MHLLLFITLSMIETFQSKLYMFHNRINLADYKIIFYHINKRV